MVGIVSGFRTGLSGYQINKSSIIEEIDLYFLNSNPLVCNDGPILHIFFNLTTIFFINRILEITF